MSRLYDGWDTDSLLICLKERMDNIRAMCREAMDTEGACVGTHTLAEDVLRELNGGE